MKKYQKVFIAMLFSVLMIGGFIFDAKSSSMAAESRVECPISHWFINGTGTTPYRAYVGGATIGNVPAGTGVRITRIYSTSGSYSNIRFANIQTVPERFRGGSGWVLSNRVSASRPAPPCPVM